MFPVGDFLIMNSERVFDFGYSGKEKSEEWVRSPFQVDRDRIIHSSSFRRLRNKTQVFGVFTLDYYRTRLTHSLEVSQIARTIASNLNKKYGLRIDLDLIEAISLAHDIGHPPFGHLGETILNESIKSSTNGKFGFEANAQNIRILTFLEKKFYDAGENKIYGINPSLKTIDGILKYKLPYSFSDKKNHFIYDLDTFILERLHGKDFISFIKDPANSGLFTGVKNNREIFFEASRCLECQILNAADDIAYATHDLEDGIESKLIDINGQFKVEQHLKGSMSGSSMPDGVLAKAGNFFKGLRSIYGAYGGNKGSSASSAMPHIKVKTDLKEFFSRYISKFVMNVDISERKDFLSLNPALKGFPVNLNDDSYKYMLSMDSGIHMEIKALKQISYRLVMENRDIMINRYNAENILRRLFSVFSNPDNLKIYPEDFQEMFSCRLYDCFGEHGFNVMCGDYMGSMTDMYAIKLYSSLFEAKNFKEISSY